MQTTKTSPAASSASLVEGAAPATPIALRQLYGTLERYADRMALRFAVPAALLSGVLAWAFNWGRNPIPFADDGLGFGALIFYFSIVIAFGVSATGFVVGVRARNALVEPDLRHSWRLPVIPLALAYALVTALIARIALQFVDLAFKDLALPTVYALLVVGIICGLVTQKIADHAMLASVRSVLNIFVVILVAGISISAVDENNPLWWKHSFSFLGEAQSSDRMVFNGALVMSGILFVILQQFFMDYFIRLRAAGLLSTAKTRLVRSSLVGIGVALVIVGLVPFDINDLFNAVHSAAAYTLMAILFGHMLFAQRLIPDFSREFYATTWIMVVALAVMLLLHFLGSINTMGIELLGFIVAGAWFLMFMKNVVLLVGSIEGQA